MQQRRLAAMRGLIRATVNRLESGTLVDLGAAKPIALLDLVGISPDADARSGHTPALRLVFQTAKDANNSLIVVVAKTNSAAWRGINPVVSKYMLDNGSGTIPFRD